MLSENVEICRAKSVDGVWVAKFDEQPISSHKDRKGRFLMYVILF